MTELFVCAGSWLAQMPPGRQPTLPYLLKSMFISASNPSTGANLKINLHSCLWETAFMKLSPLTIQILVDYKVFSFGKIFGVMQNSNICDSVKKKVKIYPVYLLEAKFRSESNF